MKKILIFSCLIFIFVLSAYAQEYKIAEPYAHSEKSGKLPSKSTQKYTYLYDTTLIQAIKLKDEPRVKMLLYAQVNPNEKNDEGFTPLYFAAQYLSPEILTMLIDRGARVNLLSKYNLTPLMAAAAAGRDDNVKILLEYGADPNLTDIKDLTALNHALKNEHLKVVELLAPVTTIQRDDTSSDQADIEVIPLAEAEDEVPQDMQEEQDLAELPQEEIYEEISAPAYNPTLAEIDSKIEQTRQALARLIELRTQIIQSEEKTMKEYMQLKNSKK